MPLMTDIAREAKKFAHNAPCAAKAAATRALHMLRALLPQIRFANRTTGHVNLGQHCATNPAQEQCYAPRSFLYVGT